MLRVVLAVTLLCVYVVEGRHYLLRWSTNDDVSLQKFDLGDHFLNPDNGALEVIANEDQMTQLKEANVPFKVLKESMPLYERFPNATSRGWEAPPTGYLNLQQIENFLADTVASYPSIVANVDLSAYGPPTFEGRRMSMIKISDNVEVDEDEPNVIIVSAHHSRELVTPEIAMDTVRRLTEGYETDPQLRALVDEYQIYVVPVVNPDGYFHVFEVDDFWRKNKKNGYGVDINRNYDQNWENGGGSTDTASQTYKGAFPLSEEESTTLTQFERERNVAKLMDFHSSGREVLPGFRFAPAAAEVHDYNWERARFLAGLASYVTRVPSADAEHQQGAIQDITTFAWLTETHTSFQPPIESAYEEVRRVWPLTLAFLENSIPVQGHVVSSQDGLPLQAEILIPGIFGPGEPHTRRSGGPFGRFHIFLIDGIYSVTFVAEGHAPVTQTITVNAASPQDNVVITMPTL